MTNPLRKPFIELATIHVTPFSLARYATGPALLFTMHRSDDDNLHKSTKVSALLGQCVTPVNYKCRKLFQMDARIPN